MLTPLIDRHVSFFVGQSQLAPVYPDLHWHLGCLVATSHTHVPPFRTCQGDRGKREGFSFREVLKKQKEAKQDKTKHNTIVDKRAHSRYR